MSRRLAKQVWTLMNVMKTAITLASNSTDVDEASNQNAGEIDEAVTWNSAGPPPEVGGTVTGRPGASRYKSQMGTHEWSEQYYEVNLEFQCPNRNS